MGRPPIFNSRQGPSRRWILPVVVWLTLGTNFTHAAVLLVPGNSPTIQGAIDQAAPGDEIRVKAGTYNESLVLKSDITLRGGYTALPNGPRDIWGEGTVVDARADPGGFPTRAATLDTVANVTIDGLQLTGAKRGSIPVAFRGAGVFVRNTTQDVRIVNCIIRDNEGGVRGSGVSTSGSTGGGIYCENASPRIENCAITGNQATSGGGVYLSQGVPLFVNCIIYGNVASGYQVHAGPVTTFVPGSGGGVGGSQDAGIFINCLIYGNTADQGQGGGFHQSSSSVVNTVVWNNHPIQIRGTQLAASFSCVQGGYPGAISDDPRFVNEAIGNWRPAKFSPLIDAGKAMAQTHADLFGTPRGYNGFSGPRGDGSDTDIGPLEYTGELHGNNAVPFSVWEAYQ